MKLERGQIEQIKEYVGCSRVFIHAVLNGERSKYSRAAKKIFKVIEILKQSKKDTKEKVERALAKIDKEFNN